MQTHPPQLLVSVRSSDEAQIALASRVDILDVKEPNHGSLGRVSDTTLRKIVQETGRLTPRVPFSAAMGEVSDWESSSCLRLPGGLTYLKLGLAGLSSDPHWIDRWVRLRRAIEATVETGPPTPKWVAVVYADFELAKAPPISQVIKAAMETDCVGVLFDTYHKQSGRLWDWIAPIEMRRLCRTIRERGLLTAVAGRLTLRDIPEAVSTGADIVAVRSAACGESNRRGRIDGNAIDALRREIHRTSLLGSVANPTIDSAERSTMGTL